MKRNKLYTVNKFNKGMFMPADVDRTHQNIFDGYTSSYMGGNYDVGAAKAAYYGNTFAGTSGYTGGNYDVNTAKGLTYGGGNIVSSSGIPSGNTDVKGETATGGSGSAKGAASSAAIGALHGALSSPWGSEGDYWYSPHGLQDLGDPFYNAGRTKYGHKTHKASSTLRGISSALLGGSASAGAGAAGGGGGGSASGYMALAAIVPQAIADILDNGWGVAWNEKLMNDVAQNNQRANSLTSAVSKASSLDELSGLSNYLSPYYTITSGNVGEAGTFAGDKLDEKAAELNEAQDRSVGYLNRAFKNSALNLRKDQIGNYLRNYSAYGGPLGSPYGGALGLMQQNRYFDTIDKRSEAIAGKGQGMQTGFTGGAKTFAGGGLKAAFLDEFSSDPIGAAVRYNRGLEALAAQEEARQIEAAKEAEYLGLQQRLANLETENPGLQALMAAQTLPIVPEIPEETHVSSLTPSKATSNGSTWDYIEDQLRRSGKFNDVQIEGIKYNLQRESSLDPTAVGDGGAAFGLGQWHGKRQPKDRSLEGQTQHLIDTLSNFDGKEHWIGRGNYEGFLNARTPEEAHYYIAKGYERPAQRIVDKVKRDSDMSLSRLKAFGGELGTNGTDWTNGLLYIDEGGTHEENPMEGVLMGVDAEGIPNLVEEGETVYNNYVFSDRMNVPDFMYKELGLGGAIKKKGKGMSFADASKKLAKESEQRPNDPISQAGLEASLSKLAEVQETERMRQQAEEYMGLEGYACGGKMGRKYDNGGFKNWWIRNITPKDAHGTRVDYGKVYTSISGKKDLTRSEDVYKALETMYNADPSKFGTYDFDTYSMLTVGDGTTKGHRFEVTSLQNQVGNTGIGATTGNAGTTGRSDNRYGKDETTGPTVKRELPPLDIPTLDSVTFAPKAPTTVSKDDLKGLADTVEKAKNDYKRRIGEGYDPYPTWMRYAPVAGAGAMALTDMFGLTNKPDYRMAERLEAAAQVAGLAPNITFKPIGDYMRYEPLDRMFQQNQLNAIARAADRTIVNSSLPTASKYAALLAANYNNQIAAGNLFRQEQEYNRAQYERKKEYDRKTNMFNSQMDLEAAMANARYRQQAQSLGLSGLAQAAALRDQIDARTGAAKSANLTNFLTSLGNIGRENFALNQINSDRSRQYGIYSNGVSDYKRTAKGKKGSRWT